MGTHPIFESDFDCLTDMSDNETESVPVVKDIGSGDDQDDSRLSSLLSRNYYTIAHDLNPSDEKHEKQGPFDDSAIVYTADEPSFLNTGGGTLTITVGNPEKQQTPMESYITYEVRTETDRVEYSIQQSTIRRRYQDFVWLKTKFEENHPGTIIPPLPEKQAVKGVLDRFSVEFVTRRCQGLNHFLSRVSQHPKLNRSKALKTFLTLSSTDFTIMRKNDTGGIGGKLLGLKSVQLSSPKEIKPEWMSIADRQDQLSHRMKSLEGNTEKMAFEMSQFKEDLDVLLPTLNSWEKSETKEELTLALGKFRDTTSQCLECTNKFQNALTERVQPGFHEYALYAESVRKLLKRRSAHQLEHEGFAQIVHSKKGDLEATRNGAFSISNIIQGNTEQNKQERMAKLEVEIREFQAATSIAEDNLTKLELAAQQEIENYELNRAFDLAATLQKLAQTQATYYEESAEAWRQATSVDLGE